MHYFALQEKEQIFSNLKALRERIAFASVATWYDGKREEGEASFWQMYQNLDIALNHTEVIYS